MAYSEEQLAAMVRGDSVHRGVYTDPAIFDMEMERIYGRAWIYVGHESQVPRTATITPRAWATGRADGARGGWPRACCTTAVRTRAPRWWRTARAARASSSAARTMPGPSSWTAATWACRSSRAWKARPMTRPTPRSRCAAARVDSYRGFVFASQSAEGPALEDFLGGVRSSIDNLCDRSPVGEVEVAGGVFRVMQRSNWKVFYENLHDTMHARVTHESSFAAARDEARKSARCRSSCTSWTATASPTNSGKSWNCAPTRTATAIWKASSTRRGRARSDFAGALRDAGGGLWRGQGAPGAGHEPAQHRDLRQRLAPYRVPAVPRDPAGGRGPHADRDPDLPLQGAPDGVFKRAMLYANVINSPSSNVMPDDIELYNRCRKAMPRAAANGSACTATTAPTAATSRAWCRSTAPANCPCATSSAPGATTCRPAP